MKRRTFLKKLGVLSASVAVAPNIILKNKSKESKPLTLTETTVEGKKYYIPIYDSEEE